MEGRWRVFSSIRSSIVTACKIMNARASGYKSCFRKWRYNTS